MRTFGFLANQIQLPGGDRRTLTGRVSNPSKRGVPLPSPSVATLNASAQSSASTGASATSDRSRSTNGNSTWVYAYTARNLYGFVCETCSSYKRDMAAYQKSEEKFLTVLVQKGQWCRVCTQTVQVNGEESLQFFAQCTLVDADTGSTRAAWVIVREQRYRDSTLMKNIARYSVVPENGTKRNCRMCKLGSKAACTTK